MAQDDGSGKTLLLIGGAAAAAYFFWPQISTALGIAAPATSPVTSPLQTDPSAAQQTNSSPVTTGVPGVTTTNGVSSYNSGVVGSGTVTNVPVNTPIPTPGAPVNNCPNGWQLDAQGVCTQYTDQMLLADINSIPWSGSGNIPAEQISRIDPQILSSYTQYPGITPGTVLAYILGLGTGSVANGTIMNGSDGNAYQLINGVFVRQGTSTQQTQATIPAPIAAAVAASASATAAANANNLLAIPPAPPPAPATTTPASTGPDLVSGLVSLTDLSNPGKFYVGDTFVVRISGAPPNSPVAVQAKGNTVSMGQTDSTGAWSHQSVWQSGDIGSWFENWIVGGSGVGILSFTVSAASALKGVSGLHRLRGALPITPTVLTKAAVDPETAALVGRDPRAMLSSRQWNYYYGQATGQLQIAQLHPAGHPDVLMSASDYQLRRAAAGLPVTAETARLGMIRNSLPGMFPLGGIGTGPDRVPYIPPGNNNIYRVVGRGAVTKLGLVKNGGGAHRWARSPFPRPAQWRTAED
jgi:hypothetical protein